MNQFYKILAAFGIGGLTGIFIMDWVIKKNPPTKKHPIEVQCFWQTNGYSSYPQFECDSIKGDTLWKDGNQIIAKNIINVSFK